ncbi:MAG TPA: hypothetical protein VFX25_33120 [Streptosporangiaceae bacterium]|nr:hypothetical protein [Streptosporangiaceae bacterium]
MFDKVTIAYRGAGYEIGQGRGFYGVWAVGASRGEPLQRWAETPDGWSAAWTRFASMESPGTIVPVGRNNPPLSPDGSHAAGNPVSPGQYAAHDRAAAAAAAGMRAGAIVAAGLLGIGVALGVAGLFPAYLGSVSLADRTDQVLPHAIYLAVWTVSAVLILLGGVRPRLGALLSLGLSAVTFGLLFSDAGLAVGGNGTPGGAGLILTLLGWFACAVGSVLAFLIRPASPQGPDGETGSLGRPSGAAAGPVVMLILAGLGVAASFAPAWDSFTLHTAAGQTQSLTVGDAFASTNPGLVITGDVLVMIAVAAAVIVAAFWRPVRHGGVLLAGAAIPMAAQAISALVQASEPASPAQFGVSNAQASALGLTIDSGLTPAFWIYCAFGVVLLVSCAWMLFTPQPAAAPGPVPAAAADPVPATDDGRTTAQHEHLSAEPHDGEPRDGEPRDGEPHDADGEQDSADGEQDSAHQAAPAQGMK